uniref:RING-type domain-containing protein n=1 Tax=Panagrolaimus sp. ES5 TaxID=591445 RepID=A0AC34FWG8_9BILA
MKSSAIPKLPFDQCLICFSSIKPCDSFITCNHRFHLRCIKEWIQYNGKCPDSDCLADILHLYIETPEDCELFYLTRIRLHFSRKRLCRLTNPQIKKEIAEFIDRSKDENLPSRVRLQDIIIAKHMIKFLKTKKKTLGCCKTNHLLEITNREIIQIRKSLQTEYDALMEKETAVVERI